jgi:hypothetical protein
MLVGDSPFVGATPEAIMRAHIQVQPDLGKLAEVGVPAGLCDLIEFMLAKEPAARPPVDELIRELPQYGRPSKVSATPGRTLTALRRQVEDPNDETRINVRPAGQPRRRRGRVVASVALLATLLLGWALGAVFMTTLGLPLAIDSRAAQLNSTSAVIVRQAADLLRGTPMPPAQAAVAALSETAILSTSLNLTPTFTTVISTSVPSLPVSSYARVPGRLRKLPNGRKVDWFIDNDMPGLTIDPPLDSELGRKFWTKLDYSDDEDYGAGYVTVQAGETVSVSWTMDVPLEQGFYEIFVYRPSYFRNFVAESVQYRVFLGRTELRPFDGTNYVDQQTTRGTWVSLGGYELTKPDILSVHLDVEGARPIAYEVDVDAIGIVRLGEKRLLSK